MGVVTSPALRRRATIELPDMYDDERRMGDAVQVGTGLGSAPEKKDRPSGGACW
jgi:hypothetical protein